MVKLRKSLVFIDTGFLKRYRLRNEAYVELFKYSKQNSIVLCTSRICLEEWRTQKEKDLTNFHRTTTQQLSSHCGENYFSYKIFNEGKFSELENLDEIKSQTQKIVSDFIRENNIKCFHPVEHHIDNTWESYFEGNLPFKQPKNRKDIPDAWIFEAAKDALAEYSDIPKENLFCLSGDDTMNTSLESLNFKSIDIVELIKILTSEENEETEKDHKVQPNQIQFDKEIDTKNQSELERLLSKSLSKDMRDVVLRLLGYVTALNSPSHDALIQCVSRNGYNQEEIRAYATILSQESNGYIKNTGNHFLVGNKTVCDQAAEIVQGEIIAMLDED